MHQAPAPLPPAPPSMALLRGVSRSFYLSMRVLPAPLRTPVATAYLLARATDTVADTAAVPVPERQAHLAALASAIDGGAPAGAACQQLAATFAPKQHDAAEQRLILALPACLAALGALPAEDQADVRGVLQAIVRGQALDLARFAAGTATAPAALASRAELDDYTWLVAGCVGEFWTRLGLRHLPGYAELPADRMLALGRRYGMGLQLVNIVRDAGEDLAAGRCYLPADALATLGLSPAGVAARPDAALPLLDSLRADARSALHDGLAYALAVNHRRARAAAALPALIGLRTLDRLDAAGASALRQRVKVPRAEVRALVLGLALGAASRATLRRLAGPHAAAMGQSPP
ncbi:MAG: squalene/phytoene synthase family protein [Burkholderiaceae bacterium]|nr:squalene/phytoene synthase family protein [Burkholderiaceae bacterium]